MLIFRQQGLKGRPEGLHLAIHEEIDYGRSYTTGT